MMSQQFTTTWICPTKLWELCHQHADQEGTCLITSEEGVYLGLAPRRILKLIPSQTAWEELQLFVSQAQMPVMGFIGYEMGAFADPSYALPWHQSALPSVVFFEPTVLYAATHLPALKEASCLQLTKRALEDCASYLAKINTICERIAQGKVYQVNLSQSFQFPHKGVESFALFKALYARNPARYAAYLNCGEQNILSLSPELFVKVCQGIITTSPIKGTAPRGATRLEDEKLKEALRQSVKNRSELLMITDLMRNDLYQVCQPGSLKIVNLCELQTHIDVFHLVSTLTGKLKLLDPVQILRRLFPAGSITGCPKKAAIEVIAELEQRPRGVYTGALGMFFPNQDFCFNVAIRTLTMTSENLEVQLGGGIVYDSDPKEEYLETLYKGRTFFHVLSKAEYAN